VPDGCAQQDGDVDRDIERHNDEHQTVTNGNANDMEQCLQQQKENQASRFTDWLPASPHCVHLYFVN